MNRKRYIKSYITLLKLELLTFSFSKRMTNINLYSNSFGWQLFIFLKKVDYGGFGKNRIVAELGIFCCKLELNKVSELKKIPNIVSVVL